MLSQAICAEFVNKFSEASPDDTATAEATETLRAHARGLAKNLAWMPNVRSSKVFAKRCRALGEELGRALRKTKSPSSGLQTLRDSSAFLEGCYSEVYESLCPLRKTPHVRMVDGSILPRVLAVAEDSLRTAGHRCDERMFTQYVDAFQEVTVLNLAELWALISAMKLVLLERLAANARVPERSEHHREELAVCLDSLLKINQIGWREVVEPLIVFDRFLQKDPAGGYSGMAPESHDLYRNEVANIAKYSDLSEGEVALVALEMAQKAHRKPHHDPRMANRLAHVGYYLVAEGADALKQKAAFRPPLKQRLQAFAKAHPDDFHTPAIALLTAVIAATVVNLSGFDYWSFGMFLFMLLVLVETPARRPPLDP